MSQTLPDILGDLEALRQQASTDHRAALRAIERFERLTTYRDEIRDLPQVRDALTSFRAELEAAGGAIGERIAARIDLQAFRMEGEAVAGGEGATLAWCERALELAAALPHLPERFAEATAQALKYADLLIEAHPAAFLPAAEALVPRLDEEDPPAGPYQTLLLQLSLCEELAAWDEAEGLAASPAEGWTAAFAKVSGEAVAAASEAWATSLRWKESVRELLERAKAALETARGPATIGLFALHDDLQSLEEDYVLLRRIRGGELILTRAGGQLFLDWYGSGSPTLLVGGVPIPQERQLAGRAQARWPLDLDAQGQTLRIEFDDETIEVRLPRA